MLIDKIFNRTNESEQTKELNETKLNESSETNNSDEDISKKKEAFKSLQDALLQVPNKSKEEQQQDYIRYLKMVDPKTDKPYNIPLLDLTDPNYSSKYVEFMKMKEYNPEGFNRLIGWL